MDDDNVWADTPPRSVYGSQASVPPVEPVPDPVETVQTSTSVKESSKSANSLIPEPLHIPNPLQDDISSQSEASIREDNSVESLKRVSLTSLEEVAEKPVDDPLSFPIQELAIESPKTAPLDEPLYTFEVKVSDPIRVPEALSSHIEYKVTTRTTSPQYKNVECSVNRRFRDFLWLYNRLVLDHPGVIIPPVPEKHAIGRFEDEFIETRRLALERFLNKATSHPKLQNNKHLQMFLESETFRADKKKEEKGGLFSYSETNTPQITAPFQKLPDAHPFFENKRSEAEALEQHLKQLMKSLETYIKMKREIGTALLGMGDSMVALSGIDTTPTLQKKLLSLGNIHKKVKDLYEKQAKNDINHISVTVDEHVRIIGSIKVAFQERNKIHAKWQAASVNLNKRKETLEKLQASSKHRTDKIAVAKVEIEDAEKELQEAQGQLNQVNDVLISEFERFDKEKITDFTVAIKSFLSGLLDTQKDIIAAWEEYE